MIVETLRIVHADVGECGTERSLGVNDRVRMSESSQKGERRLVLAGAKKPPHFKNTAQTQRSIEPQDTWVQFPGCT